VRQGTYFYKTEQFKPKTKPPGMEEYILRSKKEANGRKWLVRHKNTRKTAKAEKPCRHQLPSTPPRRSKNATKSL
jgi:hypothetical protein